MSLKTVYNDTNKVVSQKLDIRYSVDPSEDGTYYTVTRLASMQYAFIGMDEDTATQCAMAKSAQYMREYSKLRTVSGQAIPSVVKVRERKTDVAARHQAGSAWNVEISVSETDVKAVAEAPLDPAALFAAENARNYDGGNYGDALKIESATRSTVGTETKITIEYSQDIRDFDKDRLTIQGKETESGEWFLCRQEDGAASGTVVTKRDAAIVRLLYGSIESAAVAVEEE